MDTIERLTALEARIDRLERLAPPAPATPRQLARPAPRAMPAARPAKPAPAPKPPALPLEDLLGGRVLAWIGGAAVVLGLAFLFALAVSRGWIGEAARVMLGGGGAMAALAVGIWLHERRARTEAALAATAAGVAGLFVTVAVAGPVYDLLPAPAVLVATAIIGAVGTALALRWDSAGIAALGLLGGIAAPVLAGIAGEGPSIPLVLAGLACTATVAAHRRWGWLALAGFGAATPQWLLWLAGQPGSRVAFVVVLAFAALGIVAATGYEVRVRAEELRVSSAVLLGLNAFAAAAAGAVALMENGDHGTAEALLALLAATHLAAGLRPGPLMRRMSPDLGLFALTIGTVLANVAAAIVLEGVALTAVLAASGLGLAVVTRHVRDERSNTVAALGLGAHLAHAAVSALLVAPPADLAGGRPGAAGVAALVLLAAGCLVSGRIARAGHPAVRVALDSAGLLTVAYLTAASLDGTPLVLAYAAEAILMARIAGRTSDEVAAGAWACFTALVGMLALGLHAEPGALIDGLSAPLRDASGVVALAAALGAGALHLGPLDRRAPAVLWCAAAVALFYLASTLVVTALGGGSEAQTALSGFWSLSGVAALVSGLMRDDRRLRLAGLAVILLAVGKVFVFDLATLDSVERVASFVGLGLLLLAAAFVWQRIRPAVLPDLRHVPPGVR